MTNEEARSSLQQWEDLLRSKTILQEAERLAEAVVDPFNASADESWELIWNKPLFANTKVAYGERALDKLSPFMDGAWRDWGHQAGPFVIYHNGGSNKRSNFNVAGSNASEIDSLKIARHRLLAIQGGANFLRRLVEINPDHPMRPFAELDRGKMIERIQSDAGRGWGHVTALHLLTDFGLAVKPDLHVVRAVKAIGLLTDLAERSVPSLKDALRINDAVDELGKQIYGASYGPRNRRYLDKVLMELSRQELLNEVNLLER